MPERDPRWENVHAYVGPVQSYVFDEEEETEPVDIDRLVEILIAVEYNDRLYYAKHITPKDNFEDTEFNYLSWTLAKMVRRLDRILIGTE